MSRRNARVLAMVDITGKSQPAVDALAGIARTRTALEAVEVYDKIEPS